MNKRIIGLILILLFTYFECSFVFAKDTQSRKLSGAHRTKALSFDDDVVEGLNRNPMDSLENISKRDGRDQEHLYKKRTHFLREMKETTKEMGYSK